MLVVFWTRKHHKFLVVGWENDWETYGELAKSFKSAFTFNGFNTIGFPLIVNLFLPLTKNLIEAGKFAVSFAGLILIFGVFFLSAQFLPQRKAFFVTLLFTVNWYFAIHTTLLAGTDIWWSSMTIWALVFAVLYLRTEEKVFAGVAGGFAGLAYIFRYTGIILPLTVILLFVSLWITRRSEIRRHFMPLLVFLGAYLLVALPQLIVNSRGGGSPFANYHAKNVWFGLYGDLNWVENWNAAPDNISLFSVIASSPKLFFKHIVYEFAKSMVRVGFMLFGIDVKMSLYLIPRWLLVVFSFMFIAGVLLLFVVSSLKGKIVSLWNAERAILILILSFFLIYTLATSMVFSIYRLFIPFIPIFYIFIARIFTLDKKSRLLRALAVAFLLCGMILGFIAHIEAFDRGYSFPVERFLSEMESPGGILLYGPYTHLRYYTDRPVTVLRSDMDTADILNRFFENRSRYLVVMTSLPFTKETPQKFPDGLKKLGLYNFRLVDFIQKPRSIYLWEYNEPFLD